MTKIENLGMGVLLNALAGRGSDDITPHLGKRIAKVETTDTAFSVELEDGTRLVVTDDGQSCCENRYLSCDGDALEYWTGGDFLGFQTAGDNTETGEYDNCHEITFVNLLTSKGVQAFSAHNEHNGYYGGFSLMVKVNP